jgi:hypothetical protein
MLLLAVACVTLALALGAWALVVSALRSAGWRALDEEARRLRDEEG